jgi:predicted TPR repeat methyltransferase
MKTQMGSAQVSGQVSAQVSGQVFDPVFDPVPAQVSGLPYIPLSGSYASGDRAADRRAEFAETLAGLDDFSAAAETLASALELVPGWAAGWYRLGELHQSAGALKGAARAWRRAMALDPADRFGSRARLELLTGERVADALPPAFVEALFDQYAPRFDAALIDGLAYRGPQILMRALDEAGLRNVARALDLGCGTGLMGEVVRLRCGVLEGVDLSAGMLEIARRRQLYDHLFKADICALPLDESGYDLIVAADVFAYVGALEGVIAWCAGSLTPGGRLAFTVEAADGAGLVLRESRRYAHGRAYLAALMAQAGFEAVRIEACVVRKDRGADIESFVVTATKPAARRALEGDGEVEIAA